MTRKQPTTEKITITRGSGNVYADLGLPNAEELWAKSGLAIRIFKAIKDRRLTQAKAAQILGISQPKVSDLMRGRLDGFSSDRLLRFLTALGCDVNITVSRPHPRTSGEVTISAW